MSKYYKVSDGIIEEGRHIWEQTEEYNKRVQELRQQLDTKYEILIKSERKWFKKQIIRIKYIFDLKKEKNKISSIRNLHNNSNLNE